MRNYVSEGVDIYLPVGEGKTAGTPVAVGEIVGVCVVDADPGGGATVRTKGIFLLPVKGSDGTNDVAVAVGDRLYIDPSTGEISKNSSKVPFGLALGEVAAGSTETIEVRVSC